MRSVQTVEFVLKSVGLSLAEIQAETGLVADSSTAQGSKHPEGPIPRTNIWTLQSSDSADPIERQISTLVNRLLPAKKALRLLCMREDTVAFLTLVRHFYPSDSDLGIGFFIEPAVLRVLSEIGAGIDVDEYDYSEVTNP